MKRRWLRFPGFGPKMVVEGLDSSEEFCSRLVDISREEGDFAAEKPIYCYWKDQFFKRVGKED